MHPHRHALVAAATLCLLSCGPGPRPAEDLDLGVARSPIGEPSGTYPHTGERIFHYLTNRARIDPVNSDVCGKGFNVPIVKPLEWNLLLNQVARFHSREMALAPCFQHASCGYPLGTGLNTCSSAIPPEQGGSCTLQSESYCMGYDPVTKLCNAKCAPDAKSPDRLGTFYRFGLFGYSGLTGENIAMGYSDERGAFCAYFLEGPEPSPPDGEEHGHFVNIMRRSFTEVGHGNVNLPHPSCSNKKRYYTQDFGGKVVPQSILSVGAYWKKPGAANPIFGAIWNHTAAPTSIHVVIDGACTLLSLAAGKSAMGAYEASVAVPAGCHTYYFVGTTSAGQEVTFPTNGSLAIAGSGGTCAADYESSRTPGTCGGTACTPGFVCTTPDGCRKGTVDCGTGQPVCGSLVNVADGTGCGGGKVCGGGVCGGCPPGAPCASTDGCKKGTTDCASGQPVCVNLASVPDNTPCPGGKVCGGGVCGGCTAGPPCTSADGCKKGTTDCTTGVPVCAGLASVPDSTPCTGGKLCGGGVCGGCIAGAACSEASGCRKGTLSCPGGTPRCDGLADVANGTSCGTAAVCFNGACNPCAAGTACDDPGGNVCKKGTIGCGTGQPICGGLAFLANGTSCGSDQVCSEGACVACKSGVACDDGNPCKAGFTTCATGKSVCGGLASVADSKPCGGTKVCVSGRCIECVEGEACVVGDGCRVGTLRCATGAFCSGIKDAPDGTACPAGQCVIGVCQATDGGLATGADAGAPVDPTGADASGAVPLEPKGCGCAGVSGGVVEILAALVFPAVRRRRRARDVIWSAAA